MSGGDGNMRRIGGSKRCSDGFVVLSGVEQTIGRGGRAVWQQQTLWSVFVTIGQAGRCANLSHFQVLIALGRQHLPSVLPLNTTQNFVVRPQVTATVCTTCTVNLGRNCPVSEYSEGRTRGIFVNVRPVC